MDISELDLKLYELFATDIKKVLVDIRTYRIEVEKPHWHNVFAKAKELGFISIGIGQFPMSPEHLLIAQRDLKTPSVEIDCDSSLPLLEQSDETKKALIDLFS